MAFVSLSKMPTPPVTRVCNIPSLAGGLNIHDLPWQLAENQSPEMKNMWWGDGALRSRPGQYSLIDMGTEGGATSCAAYSYPYHGYYIFHYGKKMWAVSADMKTTKEIPVDSLTYTDEEGETVRGLPEICGSFVCHNGTLYYKTRGIYAVIDVGDDGFTAHPVDAFCPTYLINADPGTPGVGDLYQPLNRLKHSFYVTYSPAEDETTDFYAPFYDCSVIDVEILDSSGTWVSVEYGGFKYTNRQTHGVRIKNESDITAGQNNVRILFSRRTFDDFKTHYAQLMSCNQATVYGGGKGLCVVLAGCADQPNAWFWSANTDISMDPTYFPMEHYNLAGDFSDPITALGQQQNKLVIFQKSRIGAAEFGTSEIDGRTFITMDYRTISPITGCDVPGSVQLIENNLVFVNSRLGVMLIRDTTSADENNLARLSQNINGSPEKTGLLYDLENIKSVLTSYDDGERYWLTVNGHAWLWDYRIGGSVNKPESLSWFYFDGIKNPKCWFVGDSFSETFFLSGTTIRKFTTDNHGETFEASVALPVLNFGTYEVLKNVTKAIFAFDDSSGGKVDIEYQTDYGTRTDPTPINFSTAGDTPFAEVFVRKPRCLNVRHFLCRLKSSINGVGKVAFTSAQIHYTMHGIDR